MILDLLTNAKQYEALHPGFTAGFAELRRTELASVEVGRHAIDDERLILIIGNDLGRGRETARLEAHRKFIDIQFAISGNEEIGWLPTADCKSVIEPYTADRDIEFFADRPTTWLALTPGTIAIFYPHDAHAPLAGEGTLHKAVMKVAVEWH